MTGARDTPATVCTPLRSEWWALQDVLHADLIRTGRAVATAPPGPVLVAGVAGALEEDLEPGDLVVASEFRCGDRVMPSHASPLLVAELRRAGLRVRHGPLLSTTGVVHRRSTRARLATTGAVAVDTESAGMAMPEGTTVAIRAIVDTPRRPLIHPTTPLRGLAALGALRRAAPVMDRWAAATGPRELLLAGPRSFCAGVERAVDIVERALGKFGAPVYVRRQIVHNSHVVAGLEARGAVFVEEVEEVPEGSVVVLAAHGVAPEVRRQAQARRLRVIDATCPLVAKVHREVRRFAAEENTVLLIGHGDHEEVVGTRGEAPDRVQVVADPDEASRVEVADPDRVSYVMQTTLSVDEAAETVAALRERFPAMRGPHTDDICYATTNRQHAVQEVARDSDLVLVLGSRNSSNSRRLAEVAEAAGTTARLIDDAGEVELDWLAGVRRIGITAGASAPPSLVEELTTVLSGLGPVKVREAGSLVEDVQFSLPKEVSPT